MDNNFAPVRRGRNDEDPARRSMGARLLIISTAFVYTVLYLHTPLSINATYPHDDTLFMSLGRSLAEGQWLGPYTEFTLMKGPGYPFFLAAANWLGISVALAHALFHLRRNRVLRRDRAPFHEIDCAVSAPFHSAAVAPHCARSVPAADHQRVDLLRSNPLVPRSLRLHDTVHDSLDGTRILRRPQRCGLRLVLANARGRCLAGASDCDPARSRRVSCDAQTDAQ